MRTLRITAAFFVLVCIVSPATAEPLAVWRLFSHEHLYTTSCEEAEQAQLDSRYVLEGEHPAFYIETTAAPGTTPLYRFFNGHSHLYTTSRNAEGNEGYFYEGVLGYVYRARGPELIPLYRAYHPVSGDHLYTTARLEYQRATQEGGYEPEGITGYVPRTGSQTCTPTPYSVQTRGNEFKDEEDCFQGSCIDDEPELLRERPLRRRR